MSSAAQEHWFEQGRKSERAEILRRLKNHADGLHFAGDLKGEKVLRAFGKFLEDEGK